MRVVLATTRVVAALGVASLAAGCVQPAYQMPGPIPLQPYPPSVSYETTPDYRPPVSGPIPLQAPVAIQPLPPSTPSPSDADSAASEGGGAIPLQDMPAPAPAVVDTSPSPDTVAAPATPAPVVTKAPTSGAGKNVPLEGFRPMHGQTRPAP